MFKLHIFFGSEPAEHLVNGEVEDAIKSVKRGNGEFKVVEFATEAELNAYKKGLEDADGWEGIASIEGSIIETEIPHVIEKVTKKLNYK